VNVRRAVAAQVERDDTPTLGQRRQERIPQGALLGDPVHEHQTGAVAQHRVSDPGAVVRRFARYSDGHVEHVESAGNG